MQRRLSSRRSTKSRALARYSPWMSSALASRPLARRTLRRPVTSWEISRIARIGFSRVRSRMTTPSSIIRSTRSQLADLEHRGGLAHVGVADDDVEPAVLLGVGVRLVAGVDDRPAAGRRRRRPPRCARRAGETEYDAPARGLGDLAGADDDLPGHQERDQHVGQPAELAGPADQVVLVAAVGVAGRVGVVLEQVDLARDALVVEPLLGVEQQPLEDPLPRLVVGDQLADVVALGRGVLGWLPTSRYRRAPLRRKTLLLRPQLTTLRNR